MNIIQPCHTIPAEPVKSWREIESEALALRDFIRTGKFRGNYGTAFAISHAQVSHKPKNFFVINEDLKDKDLKKLLGHWCIINPKITKMETEVEFSEACMSFPFRGTKWTRRFKKIHVWYWVPFWFGLLRPVYKRLEEIPAYVFQHEADHAAGKNIYFKEPKIGKVFFEDSNI